jgi:hypothetical protein
MSFRGSPEFEGLALAYVILVLGGYIAECTDDIHPTVAFTPFSSIGIATTYEVATCCRLFDILTENRHYKDESPKRSGERSCTAVP